MSLPFSRKKRMPREQTKGLPPGSLIYTGTRTELPTQVVTHFIAEDDYQLSASYDLTLVNRRDGLRWVDVMGLTDITLVKKIGDEFGMHYLALEDVLDTTQRAKLDEFDNGLFFIIHNLRLDPVNLHLQSEQIALFLGDNFLVSFQEDPDDTFNPVRRRAQDGIGRLRKKGADYLAYALLDVIVDNYYVLLDTCETELINLEEIMHQHGVKDHSKHRLFLLKKNINLFRQRVMPLREAVTRFYRTESFCVQEANRLYLRDVVDHMAQILDSIDNYRDMIGHLESLQQAEISNRLNNVMRLLTVISTIFIPLSFIAGIYGMNFDFMPELHMQNGYFFVLGFMGISMIGMLIYFKQKGWI